MEKTVKNRYGIEIKKCCASCQSKQYKNEQLRNCKLGENGVKPTYYCDCWKMQESLDNAGKGGGKIRKQSWFRFLAESLTGDISLVEKEYNKKHGSRFLVE